MKLTWSDFEPYILQWDIPVEENDFIRNPVLILQPADVTVADKNYVHTQAVPSTTWTINHNLGKFPSISIVDTSDREWLGDIIHNSINQAVVVFAASFGGKAYCN